MSKEILEGVRLVEKEKGIEPGTLLAAIEDALLAAYRKMPDARHPVRVDLDRETLDFTAWSVTPQAWDSYLEAHPHHQILAEAPQDETDVVSAIDEPPTDEEPEPEPEIEWEWFADDVLVDVTPENFSRIAGQTAKQVLRQRINEAERSMMYDEYADRVGEIVTGIVQQDDHRYAFVDLGRMEAILPGSEKVPGERYEQGSRIKAVIIEVRAEGKGPQVVLSRRSDELIRQLFELEVPEIADGLVEIRAVAREPGYRAKIAVESKTQGVDPVGACVGPRGSRVRMVVSELRGEKIDIIPWNDEPARFVAKALAPAKVREVYVDDEHRQATVVGARRRALARDREGGPEREARPPAHGVADRHRVRDGVLRRGGRLDLHRRGVGRRGRVPRPLRRRDVVRKAMPEPGTRRKPLLRGPGPPGAGGGGGGGSLVGRAPVRQCAGCGGRSPQSRLVRLCAVGGALVIDRERRLGGRGVYLCPSAACAGRARRRGALARRLKCVAHAARRPGGAGAHGAAGGPRGRIDVVAKKTVEPEKPKETEKAAAETPAEVRPSPPPMRPCPTSSTTTRRGASTARRPPLRRRTPGSPAAMPAPSEGRRRAAAAGS